MRARNTSMRRRCLKVDQLALTRHFSMTKDWDTSPGCWGIRKFEGLFPGCFRRDRPVYMCLDDVKGDYRFSRTTWEPFDSASERKARKKYFFALHPAARRCSSAMNRRAIFRRIYSALPLAMAQRSGHISDAQAMRLRDTEDPALGADRSHVA